MPKSPLVALLMGSQSDWETMQHASDILEQLNISHQAQVISAHRTPDLLYSFAEKAKDVGYKVIIAGAGGAAHLPGMLAAKTPLPVIGVPIQSKALNGMDSLLSIVQMPGGVPVATMAIGEAGAKNAALFAASLLSLWHSNIFEALDIYRKRQTQQALDATLSHIKE